MTDRPALPPDASTDRRVERRGAFCPRCGEFVEERWAAVVDGRIVYLCWGGHRWVDRRRPDPHSG